MDKENRAIWLNKKLDQASIAEYGRAASIARRIECSNAVCQGWLGGSLPKDIVLALKFCKEFSLSLQEWATGEVSEPENKSRWLEAIKSAREFENEMGELTSDQFVMVVELILKHDSEPNGNGSSVRDTLSAVVKIVGNGNGNCG